MSEMDNPEIRADTLTGQMERLETRMERLEIQLGRMARFGWDSKIGPIADGTLDLDPLAQFEEKISLLLQHASRWRLFHIVAAQPLFIHCTTALFAKGDREAPLLEEFHLETTRICQEMSEKGRTPPFSRAAPSLQRLTLCCGILPVDFGPYSSLPRSMFPNLRELELTKMESLDHSLCFGTLRGLPNLRVLKFVNVEFNFVNPFEAVLDSQRIVLGTLEELTFEGLSFFTFGPILESLTVPNLRLLSFRGLDGFDAFITILQNKALFSNVGKVNFQSIRPSTGCDGETKWVWKLYSIMPEITSIHIDSASEVLKGPLIQGSGALEGFVNERVLLPALSEISLSGFTGGDIIELVKARHDQGVPLKSIRIDRTSIALGAVTLNHWEVLRGLVDNLRWFDASESFSSRTGEICFLSLSVVLIRCLYI